MLGYHRSERGENGTGAAKPVGLRDQNSFTVLLAVFHNSGYDQTVTLACVLWMKDPHGPPTRFYVGAERDLNIAADFSDFDSDMNKLRRRLRQSGATTFDSFTEYSAWFRRRFGIETEQALDLFHQTVSMKSVGNLTDFVRDHMLEPFEMDPRIAALIDHFDDLDRAHSAVLRAKRQTGLLEPVIADCDRHEKLRSETSELRAARDFLQPHFSNLKLALLEKRAVNLATDQERQSRAIAEICETLAILRRDESDLVRQISENGGDRIAVLSAQIEDRSTERDRHRDKFARYAKLVGALGESQAQDSDAFAVQHDRIAGLKNATEDEQADLENRITDDSVAMRKLQEEREKLALEIESLKARRSNIPSAQIDVREALCRTLGLAADEMPFAGELIQVRENEKPWKGAVERLLHNFGLSLLVPDAHYPAVVEWVDRTNLRGRLVYFRIRQTRHEELPSTHPDSVIRKIAVISNSPFYDWMERELTHRLFGINEVPSAALFSNVSSVVRLLGVKNEWETFQTMIEQTRGTFPELLPWLARRAMQALAFSADWEALLTVVKWVKDHPDSGIYLRQIDAPGVHTKLIERHRGTLAELLDLALSAEAIRDESLTLEQLRNDSHSMKLRLEQEKIPFGMLQNALREI